MRKEKLPNSAIKLRKLLAFVLLPIVTYGLNSIYQDIKTNEIIAVDHLSISYNDSSPPNPIFIIENMLPGDCANKEVVVEHLQTEEMQLVVKSDEEVDNDNLATQLNIVIRESSTDIYGGKSATGEKTLNDFFNESNPSGIPLTNYTDTETKTFEFEVCFDTDAGNEYQEKSTVFDLIFFEALPPIDLPIKCKSLEGVITAVIEGTEGNDRIKGTPASELILAYGGRDRVDGKAGDDCIVGGSGNDRKLDGGEGDDIIIGGEGNDHLDGGSGNDVIYGNSGNDKADGGAGQDVIMGNLGNDRLEGGSGDDLAYGNEGNDRIEGGSGNDNLFGGVGNDRIHGDSGNDSLYGEAGDDRLWGDSGDDNLDGGSDFDRLRGNAGLDTCVDGEILNSCEI